VTTAHKAREHASITNFVSAILLSNSIQWLRQTCCRHHPACSDLPIVESRPYARLAPSPARLSRVERPPFTHHAPKLDLHKHSPHSVEACRLYGSHSKQSNHLYPVEAFRAQHLAFRTRRLLNSHGTTFSNCGNRDAISTCSPR